MNHSFNVEIATKYDTDIATFLENIAFWINYNIANEKHFHEGRYWTFNSHKAWAKLFPYWTERQIRTIIDNAIKHGLIITGNFNKQGYDQTKWYALTDIGLSLFPTLAPPEPAPPLSCQNGQMDMTDPSNGVDEIDRPIPDINTAINTDKKTTTTEQPNTDEINVVVFSSKGQDEHIKKKLAAIPESNKPNIPLITWLKQIKFHIAKYFPNNFNHGLNAVLKLCKLTPWGTPPGYIDEDEQNRIKAEREAKHQAQLKAQEELHAKRIAEQFKTTPKINHGQNTSIALLNLCKSIGARSQACYG